MFLWDTNQNVLFQSTVSWFETNIKWPQGKDLFFFVDPFPLELSAFLKSLLLKVPLGDGLGMWGGRAAVAGWPFSPAWTLA